MWVLRRQPGGLPEYVTLDKDLTLGNSLNAWSSDPKKALGFYDQRSAEDFQKKFHHWFNHTVTIFDLK